MEWSFGALQLNADLDGIVPVAWHGMAWHGMSVQFSAIRYASPVHDLRSARFIAHSGAIA